MYNRQKWVGGCTRDSDSWLNMNQWLIRPVKEILVYRSVSNCVFANLALEEWLYTHVDLTDRRILFLCRNTPSVVIGRHQNPWMETNINLLKSRGIQLARRQSGGGTVYHDMGNLNVTVFAHRRDYDRQRNLQLVCEAVKRRWPRLNLVVNKRHDIMYEQWKVSGSAAKLGKEKSYHHYTLLLNVDSTNLSTCLLYDERLKFSWSRATSSVSSPTINLSNVIHDISYDSVCAAVSDLFFEKHGVIHTRKMEVVDPLNEVEFPGISEMRERLKDPYWLFSKTPPFSVTMATSGGEMMMEVKEGVVVSTSEHKGQQLQTLLNY